MRIHQSALKSYVRCGEQHRRQLNGEQGKQLSATAWGTVLHHSLHTLERHRDIDLAVQTYEYYWHPLNIELLTRPVEEWIARQTYSNLLVKGRNVLRAYWDLMQATDEEVLALEYPFVVPIPGTLDWATGQPHELAGTVDRLSLRQNKRVLEVCIDDWKSGRKPTHLRYNLQFTAYAFATTQQEFWTGWDDDALPDGFGEDRGYRLFQRLEKAPRHGWWINVNGGPNWVDAGLREDRDYQRFIHQVNTYARAIDNHVFPLHNDGEICAWCPFRDDCPEGINDHDE